MRFENDADRTFHDNLLRLGRGIRVPESPAAETKDRCEFVTSTIGGDSVSTMRAEPTWRRRTLWSSLGLAASVGVVIGFVAMWGHSPKVHAGEVLQKLNEQISTHTLIEITMDSIQLDELSIDGRLQVSEQAIGGDVRAVVNEDEGEISIDVALAISAEGGWILLRNLEIDDPQAALALAMFLPPGRDTLIVLPSEMMDEVGNLDTDIQSAVKELASEELMMMLAHLQENQEELGATVVERRDGTLLFTLPINDIVLERLTDVIADATEGISVGGGKVGRKVSRERGKSSDGDANMLIGATVELLYDPSAEIVREVSIVNFGDQNGSMSVRLADGEIDPALLDRDRVTDANTHVLDLEAIARMFGGN